MAKGQAIYVYDAVDLSLAPGAMVLEQQASGASRHEAVIYENKLFGYSLKVSPTTLTSGFLVLFSGCEIKTPRFGQSFEA